MDAVSDSGRGEQCSTHCRKDSKQSPCPWRKLKFPRPERATKAGDLGETTETLKTSGKGANGASGRGTKKVHTHSH